ENLLNSSDFVKLKKLIREIERGIKIFGKTKGRVIRLLARLKESNGLERVILMLEIFDMVSKSQDYKCLASEGYLNSYGHNDVERLGEVYRYIMKNYTEIIKLSEVSAIANMTATSFCKYFKVKTGKTFSSFVNEIRIGQACKLMLNEDLSIS